MDIFEQTKKTCRLYNINPARSKGQNFLISEDIYDKIIEAGDLKKNDTVLEVGPGLGFLTARLAKKVKNVIAVELDDKLAELLKTTLISQKINNVEIVNEDILEYTISNFQFLISKQIQNSNIKTQNNINDFKIIANLPYNITSLFLRKILSSDVKPDLMVLMLQKEVAERIVAKPGKMSLLAVSVQYYARPEIIDIVPADCFWPKPAVNSAIVKFEVNQKPVNLNKIAERDFFRLVKFGFSAKRKMLKNNLAGCFRISQDQAKKTLLTAGLKEDIRAQELSLDDWLELFGVTLKNVV